MRIIIKYISLSFLILALIVLTNCKKEEGIHDDQVILQILNEISADSIETKVEWLQYMGTRSMTADNRKIVAETIKNKFIQLGYTDTRIDSFYLLPTCTHNPNPTWQYNVIATLNGEVYPDKIYVVGAHYDSYINNGNPNIEAPGANDNASGMAAVFEIARVLKKKSFAPTSTIQFVAFAAEEHGLFGSIDYCTKISGNKTIGMMINHDMIAYASDPDPSKWLVNIIDYNNSVSLGVDARSLCEQYTQIKSVNDNTLYDRGDSYSFYMKGFKAIFFISNEWDPNYHSVNDISTNCNFIFCREVVKSSCAMLIKSTK